MRQIRKCSSKDIRAGADKLHEILDGRIFIPDWVGVLLVGVIGAAVPFLVLCRIGGVI